jgi:hypothetical protein
MVERMQRHWRKFWESKSGRRFEQRYQGHRQAERCRITKIYLGYLLLFGRALF